jgi:hypothetical protein
MYKRGKQFWISYYVNGKQVKKSLKTKNERVAKRKCLTSTIFIGSDKD